MIHSGQICNYGYPLEASMLPNFGIQESKSTLDDSHVFFHKLPTHFRDIVCITAVFLGTNKNMKNHHQFQSIHLFGRMVELIRLFTVVGVCAVIWVEQSWRFFFKGNTSPKTNMAMKNPPFEDVFPIENRDFPMSC